MILLLAMAGVAIAQEPSDGEDEDEVIVVTGLGRAERADRAVHLTRVITREDIERAGAISVSDVLELVPGVQIVSGVGGDGIQLQGMDPEHTLILVDGVRVGGRVNGTVDLRRISAKDVESIEIVEGPSATLYGSDAMAGVVHIRTRRGGRRVQAEVGLRAGRYLSPTRQLDPSAPDVLPLGDTLELDGTIAGGSERLRTRLSVGWAGNEATDLTRDTAGTSVNAQEQIHANATADLDVSASQTWQATARWQRFRRLGVDSPATGAVLDRTHLTEEWGLSLAPTFELTDRRRLSVLAGLRTWDDQYRVDQRGSDSQDDYQRTRDGLVQLRARYDTLAGHRLALATGAEVLGEQLQADRIDPKTVQRTRLGVFVQERWDVLGDGRLGVQASARGDVDSLFGGAVSPRAGVRWSPVPEVRLRLTGGRGFRAPDFKELYLVFENASSGYRVDGQQDLRPERSWNLMASAEALPTDSLTLRAQGFHNALTDLIQADLIEEGGAGQPARYGYVNVASARTTGAQVEAELKDADRGGLSASMRYLDSVDHGTGLPLSGRARWQASGSGQVRFPDLRTTLAARLQWTGARSFVVDGTAVPVPAQTQLDVTATVVSHDRLSVQVGVENPLDAGANPETQLLTRPRRAFVGVNGHFGPLESP